MLVDLECDEIIIACMLFEARAKEERKLLFFCYAALTHFHKPDLEVFLA